MTSPSPASSLQQLVGKPITGVRRIWYVHKGAVNESSGPLEISFADGLAVVLDAGPDGEALSVSTDRWVDPFGSHLSPENERYVEVSGKWTAFDVAERPPYSGLVGAVLENVEPHVNPEGKLIGATLRAGRTVVRAEVAGDEIAVDVL